MLTEIEVENNFNKFINLIETNIKRDGVENLVRWLKSKDTKTAPASTKYHNSFKGGLVAHSLNVYDRLKALIELVYPQEEGMEPAYSEETIALVALLHDISKVDLYEVAERNVKDKDGNWTKVPFYQTKETGRLIFGSHSMNSLYMVSKFFKLTYQEELALLYHMGGFDFTEDTLTAKNISEAFAKSPLALLLHQADMQATYLDEKSE